MRALLLIAALLLAGPAQAEAPRPFVRGSWAALRQAHAGHPAIIHFWGLTCGPCLAELPDWGTLARSKPGVDLVFVAADSVAEEPARISAALAKAGLSSAESWVFADSFQDRLFYEVDPRWHGELPYTVFVTAQGAMTAKAGTIGGGELKAWIAQQR